TDRSTRDGSKTNQGLNQFVLTVSRDARDAENLACMDFERDTADDLLAALVLDVQVLDLEDSGAGRRLAAIHGKVDFATDHQLGQVFLGGALRDSLAN